VAQGLFLVGKASDGCLAAAHGLMCYKRRLFADAEIVLCRILGVNPDNVRAMDFSRLETMPVRGLLVAEHALFYLALTYKATRRPAQALFVLEGLKERDTLVTRREDVYFQIGECCKTIGNLLHAHKAFEHIVFMEESDKRVVALANVHNAWVLFFSRPADLYGAIVALGRSIELVRDKPHTWYLLGRCYARLGQFLSAFKCYRHVIELDQENGRYWCSIGVLYFLARRYKV
jgi:tetratricopeptide (TPR) repeat protein